MKRSLLLVLSLFTAVLAPAPGSTQLIIGPNGTPVLAPAGATGSTPLSIGPNGTPTLAPVGSPGSTAAPVGSNGFPAAPTTTSMANAGRGH